jgi:hypothetical protein
MQAVYSSETSVDLKLDYTAFVLFAKYNYNGQVKEDEVGRVCSTNGGKRNAYRILVGKPGDK